MRWRAVLVSIDLRSRGFVRGGGRSEAKSPPEVCRWRVVRAEARDHRFQWRRRQHRHSLEVEHLGLGSEQLAWVAATSLAAFLTARKAKLLPSQRASHCRALEQGISPKSLSFARARGTSRTTGAPHGPPVRVERHDSTRDTSNGALLSPRLIVGDLLNQTRSERPLSRI